MENEKSTGNKYTVKDAAIIGIFCAVMLVVFMVYSTLTGACAAVFLFCSLSPPTKVANFPQFPVDFLFADFVFQKVSTI